MSGSPVHLEKDGHSLTILGIIADPIQTVMIFLADGPAIKYRPATPAMLSEQRLADTYYARDDRPVGYLIPGETHTPLGKLFHVVSPPLRPEGEELEIIFWLDNEEILRHTVFVSPEEISRLSEVQNLDASYSFGRHELVVNQRVRTPVEEMLEITTSEGRLHVQGVTNTGEILNYNWLRGIGTLDGRWTSVYTVGHNNKVFKEVTILPVMWEQVNGYTLTPEQPSAEIPLGETGRSITATVTDWGTVSQEFHLQMDKDGKIGTNGLPWLRFALLTADGRRIAEVNSWTGYRGWESYIEGWPLGSEDKIVGVEVTEVLVQHEPITVDFRR